MTYPGKIKKSFQGGEKCKDFSKWSCCNGRPAQVENCQGGEDFSK
jgi:hypothetical protein